MSCRVMQCVGVSCSELQWVAVWCCSVVLQCVEMSCSAACPLRASPHQARHDGLQRVAESCSVLQCVALCCSAVYRCRAPPHPAGCAGFDQKSPFLDPNRPNFGQKSCARSKALFLQSHKTIVEQQEKRKRKPLILKNSYPLRKPCFLQKSCVCICIRVVFECEC